MRHTGIVLTLISLFCTATAFSAPRDSLKKDYPEHEFLNDLVHDTKVTFIGGNDSTPRPNSDSVISTITKFYINQFNHFQDPRAPYFMFMSKDANLAMGVGGVVRMRGWFDWNGSIQANGFSPYLIGIPKDPANMRKLGATPAGCAIFMTIMGRRSRIGDFMAYIEGNFDGYQHVGFKLKKAYVTVNDWTVGYAPSTFSDPNAQPPTIDGAGPNGRITHTNILVRYMHSFRDRWSVAASFEFPDSHPDITDGHGIGVGKLRSDKLHLQRGVLCADVNTVKIFRGRVLFRVGGTDQNDRLNFVIAIIVIIGDLIAFGSLLGPDVAGNGHRNRSGIHGGLAGIKAHRLNDKLYANIVGDVLGKENVQPYILLLPVLGGIDKFHWGKIGGQGDMQLAGGLDLVKNAVGCGARFGWGCVRYRPCGGRRRCCAAGAEHEKRNSGESERKDFDKWFLFHGCMPPM